MPLYSFLLPCPILLLCAILLRARPLGRAAIRGSIPPPPRHPPAGAASLIPTECYSFPAISRQIIIRERTHWIRARRQTCLAWCGIYWFASFIIIVRDQFSRPDLSAWNAAREERWRRRGARLRSNSFSSCLCLLLITSPAHTQLTATRVVAAKPGPAFNEAAHGEGGGVVGTATGADAALWCARLTSASAQELDCFWIINHRARFTPFACHSLRSPSLSFVCTQIPNVHVSFRTSLWAQSALAGLMIPSEMQMEAFEGERQLIHLFVPKKKKKGNGCATIVSRAVSCPLCYGATLYFCCPPAAGFGGPFKGSGNIRTDINARRWHRQPRKLQRHRNSAVLHIPSPISFIPLLLTPNVWIPSAAVL